MTGPSPANPGSVPAEPRLFEIQIEFRRPRGKDQTTQFGTVGTVRLGGSFEEELDRLRKGAHAAVDASIAQLMKVGWGVAKGAAQRWKDDGSGEPVDGDGDEDDAGDGDGDGDNRG